MLVAARALQVLVAASLALLTAITALVAHNAQAVKGETAVSWGDG